MTTYFAEVPASDIGEGTRLVTPDGTLTVPVASVEWGGDIDSPDFEVVVFLDTDDELSDGLYFRSQTPVWTVRGDDEPPSADELAAHRPQRWTVEEPPAGDSVVRVLQDVARAYAADPRIGPQAAALAQVFVPTHENARYATADIARELHVVGDDRRCLEVCALLAQPFDGDYGHWAGVDSCVALAGYIVGRRAGCADEQFRYWHDRFTEPDRWTYSVVHVHPVARLFELFSDSDAAYRSAAPADRRPAAVQALTWGLELWMRGAPGGDATWGRLAERIDELVADLRVPA